MPEPALTGDPRRRVSKPVDHRPPCERCGEPLNGAASDGLCPTCVARLSQAPWLVESVTEVTGTLPWRPPRRANATVAPGPGAPVPRHFGDYELIQEIAHGGMGTVYRARQASLNRVVALKLISGGAVASAEHVKRFQAEAEVAASLTHPNIVPIHEIGEHGGQQYFSMGLVEGPSLRKRLKDRPLPLREAVALVTAVARAVHYAHQRGVLHRDLKPSNIVLDQEGKPHLTDFGLAKLVERESTLTHTNAVLGTPSYMAPEQARGATKDLTTAVDVYGLGAVLYEALTGNPPFAGGTSIETIRLVLDQEPRRPSLWNPEVDKDLETICLKCLEKEPDRRYASADALANDLDHWTRHEPIRARPVSTWEHTRKWIRRRPPIFFIMTTAVVVSLMAGLAGILWGWSQAVKARNHAVESADRAEEALDQARLAAEQAREQEDRVRSFHYAAAMNLAQEAWEQNDVRMVRRLLDTTADHPHLGFEWYYWQSQTRRHLRTLRGHWAPVTAVAYWPDGQRIVTGSEDGTSKMWDSVSGMVLLSFGDQDALHTRISVSSDGGQVVLAMPGSLPGRAAVQPVGGGDTGDGLQYLPRPAIRSLAICAEKEWIATGDDIGTVILWDACSGLELWSLEAHCGPVTSLAFSGDGRWILTAGEDRLAKVWDTTRREQPLLLEGHTGPVTAVALSADHQWIVTGSQDRTARVWDASTGQPRRTLAGHTGPVTAVALSANHQWIVTGSEDRTARVWDASTGEPRLTLAGHTGRITSVAVSADNRRILSGSNDRSAKVWDADTGKELLSLRGHTDPVTSVAVSPDSWHMLTGSEDGTAKVWSLSGGDGPPVSSGSGSHEEPTLTFAPDGHPLVIRAQDRIVQVLDARTGQPRHTFAGHTGPVTAIAVAPDGRRIVTASNRDRTAKVWDLTSGERLLSLQGHLSPITVVAFFPDEQRIITGSTDGSLRVWDARDGQSLLTLKRPEGPIHSVTVSADGKRILALGAAAPPKVFQAASEEQVVAWRAEEAAAERLRLAIESRFNQDAPSDGASASRTPQAPRASLPLPRERIIVAP
jgi:eukaryotic-like serine/threonine-protein kinase